LVVGDSHLGRFVGGDYSILPLSIACDGRAFKYYRGGIDRDRFAFNCSWRRARFVVLDVETMGWLRNGSFSDVAEEVGGWPAVFNSSRQTVYENPTALYDKAAPEDQPSPEYQENH